MWCAIVCERREKNEGIQQQKKHRKALIDRCLLLDTLLYIDRYIRRYMSINGVDVCLFRILNVWPKIQ